MIRDQKEREKEKNPLLDRSTRAHAAAATTGAGAGVSSVLVSGEVSRGATGAGSSSWGAGSSTFAGSSVAAFLSLGRKRSLTRAERRRPTLDPDLVGLGRGSGVASSTAGGSVAAAVVSLKGAKWSELEYELTRREFDSRLLHGLGNGSDNGLIDLGSWLVNGSGSNHGLSGSLGSGARQANPQSGAFLDSERARNSRLLNLGDLLLLLRALGNLGLLLAGGLEGSEELGQKGRAIRKEQSACGCQVPKGTYSPDLFLPSSLVGSATAPSVAAASCKKGWWEITRDGEVAW